MKFPLYSIYIYSVGKLVSPKDWAVKMLQHGPLVEVYIYDTFALYLPVDGKVG